MKTNLKAFCLMLAVGAAMLFAACGSSSRISQTEADGGRLVKKTPCSDCKSTRDIIRSRGIRESMDQQMAMEMARSSALQDMASKIGVAVRALIDDYANQRSVNNKQELEQRYERISKQLIDQTVQGYRTICEEYTFGKQPDGTNMYKCYYAIELDKEDAARSLYKGLSRDEKLRLDYDYEKFKEEFDREMNRADQNR